MKDRNATDFAPAFETLEARECFSTVPYGGVGGGVTVAAADVGGDNNHAGVNVALGDGSVRFIRDTIPPAGAFTGGIYVASGFATNNRD